MRTFLIILITMALTIAKSNAQSKKWQTLFDGKSFKNWHIYQHPTEAVEPKWKIVDGAMVYQKETTTKVNDLISNKEYENFELELEWKLEKGGNSGIFFCVNEDPQYTTPYLTGPEIQILDDENHPDANAGKNGNRKAGSLYDMLPSQSKAKPSEQWNKVKIKKFNNQVSVWQNGILAVSFQYQGTAWEEMKANSKFKTWEGFGKFSKGHIGLQDHGNTVSFKNIRILEL